MRAERRKRATRVGAKVRYARLGRGASKRWAAGARWAAARGRGLEDDRVRLGAACSWEHVGTEFKLQNEGQMSLVQSAAVSGRLLDRCETLCVARKRSK